jgi:hypothetical protein
MLLWCLGFYCLSRVNTMLLAVATRALIAAQQPVTVKPSTVSVIAAAQMSSKACGWHALHTSLPGLKARLAEPAHRQAPSHPTVSDELLALKVRAATAAVDGNEALPTESTFGMPSSAA